MSYGIYLPICQVRQGAILRYYYYSEPPRYKSNLEKLREEGPVTNYTGLVSQGIAKKIKKTIEILAMKTSPVWVKAPKTGKVFLFRLAFVTLTVPKYFRGTHRFLYKECLTPFLQFLRRLSCRYVWKVELTESCTVHYHLTIDKFVLYSVVAKTWNRILRKKGILDQWFQEHGHYNPPSTQIKSVLKIDKIAQYVAKYISKASEIPIPGGGKIWGCSSDLMKARYFEFEPSSLQMSQLDQMDALSFDRCQVFRVNPKYVLTDDQMALFRRWQKQ